MNWLWFILIGLTAGFLAGAVVKGHGFGLVGNILVGIVGALLGGFMFALPWVGGGGPAGKFDLRFCGRGGVVGVDRLRQTQRRLKKII